jgi:hypothetical protein
VASIVTAPRDAPRQGRAEGICGGEARRLQECAPPQAGISGGNPRTRIPTSRD